VRLRRAARRPVNLIEFHYEKRLQGEGNFGGTKMSLSSESRWRLFVVLFAVLLSLTQLLIQLRVIPDWGDRYRGLGPPESITIFGGIVLFLILRGIPWAIQETTEPKANLGSIVKRTAKAIAIIIIFLFLTLTLAVAYDRHGLESEIVRLAVAGGGSGLIVASILAIPSVRRWLNKGQKSSK
jgi:hypothetical protein